MDTLKYSMYEGEADFEWAVKLNRFSLQLLGLWPTAEQTVQEKFVSNIRVFFSCTVLVFVIIIPSIHSMIRIRKNIVLVIDNLQFNVPVITCLLRILIFWWKKEAIVPLLDMMMNDWTSPKTSRERMIMITRAQTARTIIMFGYGLMMAALSAALIMPLYGIAFRYITNITQPGRLLPLQTYYNYDTINSPLYELVYATQAIALFICIMSYSGVDNFLGFLIFHICGQLNILTHRLADLDSVANFTNTLNSCVVDHVRLLRAIVIVENTFNVLLLVLFLYFAILFAIYGVRIISLFEDGSYLSIFGLTYILTIVTNFFGHMCLYCAVGEILAAQYNEIHYAAYFNKWYTMEPRNARKIIPLMIQTSKSLHLTAGKVFPLTMATFCNLLKTSVGYISVLLTARN